MISKSAPSVPNTVKETSSPSASFVVTSKTFICPFVTSTLSDRSIKTGSLSFIFKIVTEKSGEVEVRFPSEAITFKR